MLNIYKKKQSDNGSGELKELTKISRGTWVNVVAPTNSEIKFIEKEFKVSEEIIQSVLNKDTMPRIEHYHDEGYHLVIFRVVQHIDDGPPTTVPLGIFFFSKKKC